MSIFQVLTLGHLKTAKFFCSRWKNDIKIINSGEIYMWVDKTKLWEKKGSSELINFIGDYLDRKFNEMVNQLNKIKKMKDIKDMKENNKLEKKCSDRTFLNNVYECCKGLLKDSEFNGKIDSNREVINFKNGIFNLRKGVFRKRVRDDYISVCLPYNYSDNVDKDILEKVNKIIKNVCNDEKDMAESMKSWLGYCITGETKEAKNMWLIGPKASNGKTSLSNMYSKALPIYYFEVNNKTFTTDYTKIHKQLNHCRKPIRLVVAEELKKKKQDANAIKKFVDGSNINIEVMHGTCISVDLHAKLMTISNHSPNFNTDQGLRRRGLLAEFKNEFLDSDEYEKRKKEKGIYKADVNLYKKFERLEYKLAFLNIILPYSKKYYEKGLIISKQIKEDFKNLCNDNDEIKTFIDDNFTRTDKSSDVVNKNEILELKNSLSKNKMTWQYILSDLKRLRLDYNKDKMKDGIKGCVIGLKLKNN